MEFKIAIFSLNQWALDFYGNTRRICDSIRMAYDVGAVYRAGPELEICGYSLEDAFYESDTTELSWSCLDDILDASKSLDMVIDVGMPIRHFALYNCRVICHKGRVICIRAKTKLAREGNYREYRHFQEWPSDVHTVFKLPNFVNLKGEEVPMGANITLDLLGCNGSLRVGWEICQELWDIKNTSASLYSDHGCHLIVNSSASYWELRKLETVNDMIRGISLRGSACYAYSNLVGCDGQRYVFSGRSCIYENGKLINHTPIENLFTEIQMVTHIIHPDKINEQRAQRGTHLDMGSLRSNYVTTSVSVSAREHKIDSVETRTGSTVKDIDLNPKISFELEMHNYVPLWLWDYLRRSGLKGFMLPLSGGLDSSSVALLVYGMCYHLYQMRSYTTVQTFFSVNYNILPNQVSDFLSSPQKICSLLLRCRYLSTQYSGTSTRDRAVALSSAIGADFDILSIQDLYVKSRELAGRAGSNNVTLRDQNIQARQRMVMTYDLSEGSRVVLASGNVDEAIMGYLTKYDCSSADINPIGGLCKADLKDYLKFCCSKYKTKEKLVEAINAVINAPPSAELTGAEQRDEDEIGITYDEISVLGRVRRGTYGCSGPIGAFKTIWSNRDKAPFNTLIRCLKKGGNDPHQNALELAELIKRFYRRYSTNRHKLTVLAPALHAETYSPDDNRFDHRQILWPQLERHFASIDDLVTNIAISTTLNKT